MKIFLSIIGLCLLSGCATVHEQCSKPSIASRYQSYDQCYAEISAYRKQVRESFKTERKPSMECTKNALGNFDCESN